MTRKKWNRLRRQRPELLAAPWEAMTARQIVAVRKHSKAEIIATLTAYRLSDDDRFGASSRAVITNLDGAKSPIIPKGLEQL